jgi:hypothetical protein
MKIHVTYLKKVPGNGEYSSEQFFCGLEADIPNVASREIQEQIARLFEEAKQAVQNQIEAAQERVAIKQEQPATNDAEPATPKQLGYISRLAKRRKLTMSELQDVISERFDTDNLQELTRDEASRLIDARPYLIYADSNLH